MIQALSRHQIVKWVALIAVLAIVLLSVLLQAPAPAGVGSAPVDSLETRIAQAAPSSGERSSRAQVSRPVTRLIPNVTVVSHGQVVWRGTVDLSETLAGIESGTIPPRDTFQNRERRIPVKPRDYYREFVHPTPGIPGAGSQRIVRGQGGELFYTADHYETFVALN